MGKRTVKNYPSPRLMETIGATNQTVPEAIGELVANCFDARLGDDKLQIRVSIKDGTISVIDDGKGMTDVVLESAVCIAEDMSRHIERGEGAKGHFGMGFKTSCSTLGGFYEIYTRPYGQNVEYHVEFDIEDYSKRPSGADAWDVVIEDGPVSSDGPLGELSHGTAFVIDRLKNDNVTISAVKQYLGTAFKGHIEHGDVIVVEDGHGSYPAVAEEYKYIDGTKFEFDTSCGPNDEYRITGWVALSEQTHNDGLYGFNVYRNNQLVKRWDKSWIRAHLMTSRVIGEANMDFLDATFYKQGIQQSEAWRTVSAHMKQFLKAMVKASGDVSVKGNINNPSELGKIVDSLQKEYGDASVEEEGDTSKGLARESVCEPPSGNENSESRDTKALFERAGINYCIKGVTDEGSLMVGDVPIFISCMERTDECGNVSLPFDYVFEPAREGSFPAELQVVIYGCHPFWGSKMDSQTVKTVAISDSIYRMIVEKLGLDSFDALRIRNSWLSLRMESGGTK